VPHARGPGNRSLALVSALHVQQLSAQLASAAVPTPPRVASGEGMPPTSHFIIKFIDGSRANVLSPSSSYLAQSAEPLSRPS